MGWTNWNSASFSMSTTPTPSPASTHPENMEENQLQQGIWMLWDFPLVLREYSIKSVLKRYPSPPPSFKAREFTSKDMPILCRTISYIAKEFKIEDKSWEICAKVRKKMIKMLKNRSLTCECMAREPPQSQDTSQSKETVFRRKKEFSINYTDKSGNLERLWRYLTVASNRGGIYPVYAKSCALNLSLILWSR